MLFFGFSLLCIFIEYSLTWNRKKALRQLAKANMLAIKSFQALSLNMNDHEFHEELLTYSDNVPYSYLDIDQDELFNLQINNGVVFNMFEPMHSGMISLVYLAKRTATRDDVIVKIKRKNIDARLRQDYRNIVNVFWILSFFDSRFNIKFDENLLFQQLDFSKERENIIAMRETAHALDYVYIPKVHEEVEGGNVILMEYVKGVPVKDVPIDQYDAYAKKILNYIVVSLLIHGKCHGDLHSGNVFFLGDKIGIIDFGLVYEISPEFKNAFVSLVIDIFTLPAKEAAKSFMYCGILEPVENIRNNLEEIHKENINAILERILEKVFHKDKRGSIMDIFDCLLSVLDYLKSNSLLDELQLSINPDFIKLQFIFAMGQGLVITLCKDRHIEVINECISDLFHLDYIR